MLLRYQCSHMQVPRSQFPKRLRLGKVNVYSDYSVQSIFHVPIERHVIKENTATPLFEISQAPQLVDNAEWSYSDFIKSLREDKLASVRVQNDEKALEVLAKDGTQGFVKVSDSKNKIKLIDELLDHNVRIRYKNKPTDKETMIQYLLLHLLAPFIAFAIMMMLLGRIMNRANGGLFSSKNPGKFQEIPETGVTFDDVAGCDNAKQELKEVVDFLKNPEKFKKFNVKVPNCLLVGSPGTGKTLLAKAVAGEAGVPFFSCCGSDFVMLFVGQGSKNVRDLFNEARKREKSLIFIDEIDSIAKKRGSGGFGTNDEREQTINQLLTEMDGFDSSKAVVVIGATNRPDTLDPAILRSGRFDRKVVVELPDYIGRVAILKVHTKNKPMNEDVNLESVAKITAGSTGADLENISNEAAIFAMRSERDNICMEDFEKAIDKIALGDERRTTMMSERQKKIVSAHEAGHTLVAFKVGDYDKVKKVTIIPRGLAGGVTVFEPSDERVDFSLYSKEYLENQLCVALGGRVSEELMFGESLVTTGASSDLQHVMNIARRMVTDYGFSEKLGQVAWKAGTPFQEDNTGYSQQTAYEIDEEVKAIVNKAYQRTRNILKANKDKLKKLTDALLEKETMSGDEVKDLLGL
jgi:cell division protease FtsH